MLGREMGGLAEQIGLVSGGRRFAWAIPENMRYFNLLTSILACGLIGAPAIAAAAPFGEVPAKVLAKNGATAVAFSTDGATLYAWLNGGLAHLDGTTGLLRKHQAAPRTATQLVLLAESGRLVATTEANSVLDPAKGTSQPAPAWEIVAACRAPSSDVFGVQFPTGKVGSIQRVDAKTAAAGRQVFTYPLDNGKVPAQLLPDPACTRLALFFGTEPKKEVIAIYDIATGKPTRQIKHDATIGAVSWSADGKQLLIGDSKGRLVFVDATSGRVAHTAQVATGLVTPLLPVADGSLVVAGSTGAKSLLRVLDAKTGALVQELPKAGCTQLVDVAVSPRGDRIGVACMRMTDIGEGTAVLLFGR